MVQYDCVGLLEVVVRRWNLEIDLLSFCFIDQFYVFIGWMFEEIKKLKLWLLWSFLRNVMFLVLKEFFDVVDKDIEGIIMMYDELWKVFKDYEDVFLFENICRINVLVFEIKVNVKFQVFKKDDIECYYMLVLFRQGFQGQEYFCFYGDYFFFNIDLI